MANKQEEQERPPANPAPRKRAARRARVRKLLRGDPVEGAGSRDACRKAHRGRHHKAQPRGGAQPVDRGWRADGHRPLGRHARGPCGGRVEIQRPVARRVLRGEAPAREEHQGGARMGPAGHARARSDRVHAPRAWRTGTPDARRRHPRRRVATLREGVSRGPGGRGRPAPCAEGAGHDALGVGMFAHRVIPAGHRARPALPPINAPIPACHATTN